MLKLLFCLRTFTEFHSHFHAFILTKQTIINTDCGEGMHFSVLVKNLLLTGTTRILETHPSTNWRYPSMLLHAFSSSEV